MIGAQALTSHHVLIPQYLLLGQVPDADGDAGLFDLRFSGDGASGCTTPPVL